MGKFNILRLWNDNFWGGFIKKYVDYIVSFYKIDNDEYFGVPVIVIPNGFDFDSIDIINSNEMSNDINIAAVASMRPWHGYERILYGISNYYQSNGSRNVILHLIGQGSESAKYSRIVDECNLQNHVIFHGGLYGDNLEKILEKCTLGIDSLGRHRTGISLLSSLKSREYGAKGIPFINSCNIDILEDDFPYFYKVPSDESPINLDSIIEFHDSCYKDSSRLIVARNIRNYIEAKCGMKKVISDLLFKIDE